MKFKNRAQAGKELAKHLIKYKSDKGIVLGIPRGGVVVANEVANALNWPLDVFISRKIPAPLNPEYAIGAITETGYLIINEQLIGSMPDIDPVYIDEQIKHQTEEVKRRKNLFRKNKDLPNLKNKTVILVDDGIATGLSLLASIKSLKNIEVKKIIVAVPVAPAGIKNAFLDHVDKFIALETPEDFIAVGQFYIDFPQVDEKEALVILQKK